MNVILTIAVQLIYGWFSFVGAANSYSGAGGVGREGQWKVIKWNTRHTGRSSTALVRDHTPRTAYIQVHDDSPHKSL